MNTELASGQPMSDDYRATNPTTGQQHDYLVLSEVERKADPVRPLRNSYIHEVCGAVTRLAPAIAETFAANPDFYTGTYCTGCGEHFPVDEFVWTGTSEKVGS